MPFDIESLSDRTPLVVEYKGDKINVVYRPSAFTDELVKSDTAKGVDSINYELIATIVDWDVVASGIKVPITDEGLAVVPFPIKQVINRAILDDALNPTTPARKSGAPVLTSISLNGGPQPEPSAPPNGPTAHPIGSGSAT